MPEDLRTATLRTEAPCYTYLFQPPLIYKSEDSALTNAMDQISGTLKRWPGCGFRSEDEVDQRGMKEQAIYITRNKKGTDGKTELLRELKGHSRSAEGVRGVKEPKKRVAEEKPMVLDLRLDVQQETADEIFRILREAGIADIKVTDEQYPNIEPIKIDPTKSRSREEIATV